MSEPDVARFFDTLKSDYTETIERCFPRYREMLLTDQLDWLREVGFSDVDCTWRYLLWSVIQARK